MKVEGIIDVKYDRKLGIDKHERATFYFKGNNEDGKNVPGNIPGLNVEIANNFLQAGELLNLQVIKGEYYNSNFDKVQINLITNIKAVANEVTEVDSTIRHTIAELQDLPDKELVLDLPKFPESTMKGKNFEIHHELEIRFRRNLGVDSVIVLPVIYSSIN